MPVSEITVVAAEQIDGDVGVTAKDDGTPEQAVPAKTVMLKSLVSP
jgi:hypothetical protein